MKQKDNFTFCGHSEKLGDMIYNKMLKMWRPAQENKERGEHTVGMTVED
jgi:hypothetical protein